MHRLFFPGPNLQVAKDMALKTEARRIEDDECPLCRIVVGKPRRGFVKHVGRHMEEIALMALPRDVEEDTEESSLSTDHTSLERSSQNFDLKLPTEKDREEPIFNDDPIQIQAMQEHIAAVNAAFVRVDEDNANSVLRLPNKRKAHPRKRKPGTEAVAHAKAVRECPGGACAHCKKKKIKARDSSVTNMLSTRL